jgi:hypothetical protein
MQVFNALDLKKGKRIERRTFGAITKPIQFLSEKEKDEQWGMENLDWGEQEGIRQVRRKARKFIKNYKLAEGIIDKSDYIVSEDNEYSELIDILTREDESPLELKFFPLVPNIIRILLSEFAKRSSKVMFRATDDMSYNEMLEEKRQAIEDVLLARARQKQMLRLIELGLEVESEEAAEAMSDKSLKSLPEIEGFFRKDYQSQQEIWANVQHQADEERFKIAELEMTAFKDKLVTNEEFWHFRMLEDDYDMEVWNPILTFYQKSPDSRYVSNGNLVGKFDLLTISDVIDTQGYLMTTDQIESLEGIMPSTAEKYNLQGLQNDGSFYDASKSHAWNTNMPSLGMRQWMTSHSGSKYSGDILEQILNEGGDLFDSYGESLVRVMTYYWKSQRRLGHLFKKTRSEEIIQGIITEDYKVTEKPIYDLTVIKEKCKENLVFGEHIDWIYINDVWGGVKISANRSSHVGANDGSFEPIYLGIDCKKPSRLKFQFKGDKSLYGSRLPVEGRVAFDRVSTRGLVDSIKPHQINYNLVNNQIADILVDELGTVIVLDQNTLPRHSLGEDWGKGNLAKAYVAMKNFNMLALDTTLANTENPTNFQHFQALNLEQTQRLLGRVSLSNHFEEQAFKVVGITPQRRGESLGRQTAKGVEENLNASYAQTEQYFIEHSDQLMPRVHQMRTDLAQFYNSRRPSTRLQLMTSMDERVNFEINGIDLLSRDINLFCTTKTNHREIMRQLQTMAVQNNTTGASIYDLGGVVKAESLAELDQTLKAIEEKMQAQREQEMAHEQQLEQQRLQADDMKHQREQLIKVEEADKDRQRDLLVAEIRAAGYGSMEDINANQQSDYLDAMDQIRKTQEYQDTMNFKRDQELNKKQQQQQQMQDKREDRSSRERIADKLVTVARENKNQYDKKTGGSSTKKK